MQPEATDAGGTKFLKALDDPKFRAALLEHEREVRIRTGKLACWLVICLMPLGFTLDYFIYHDRWGAFLLLRCFCSLLVFILLGLHYTNFARRNYPIVGLPVVLLPAFFITLMIHVGGDEKAGEDAARNYYAGLNLIMLAVSAVGHWNLRETIYAVGSVTAMYLLVALGQLGGAIDFKLFYNNTYFLALTGIIVVCGNYVFNKVRFGQFLANYKLENTLVELHQTQDQLVTKEKQASLGVWSAGIIHEMNNPLNFARTGLYALRQKEKHLPDEQKADFKDLIADIDDGIQRVHTIVSDLRTYAHPGKEDDQEEVAVEEVVNVTLRFFSGDVQGHIEIIKSIPAGLTVHVNRNKLVQVLGNLLQNAVDALKTKPFANGEHPTITVSGETAGTRSRIIIRDNGPGIPKENLPKIFDPFFTTKDVGQGMGLGLGICYRIIEGFGGTISVRSEPGGFCQFTLDLPAERAEAGNN